MPDPLTALASYLTHHRRVALASMALSAGGKTRADGEQFFELRSAFGVTGYMNSGEAYEAIRLTLENNKNG